MRFLYLVFAAFLLVSLAAPGYGRIRKTCADVGYCSKQCAAMDTWSFAADCRNYCCVPPAWKGK
ncbi:CYGN protein, partial [Tachuris rubrigastra]|nr:CYGN protein [Tachuris rubrigastra]